MSKTKLRQSAATGALAFLSVVFAIAMMAGAAFAQTPRDLFGLRRIPVREFEDRPIRAGFKPQMSSAENICQWPERFAEINRSHPRLCLAGHHVTDHSREQHALAATRGR